MNEGFLFISYAEENQPFVEEFAARMRSEAGLDVWYYTEQPLGVEFVKRVIEKIEQALAVVVVLSSHSVDSVFTLNEVQHALQMQQRIIPLLLEECEGPLKLRLNHINWLDLRDGRDPVTSVLESIKQPRVLLPDYPVGQLMATPEYLHLVRPQHHILMIPNHIAPTELPFTVRLCTFGRLAQATVNLVVDQGYVSKTHASIRAHIRSDGVDFLLCDHGSRNHTFVNGELIDEQHALQDGDQIGLGTRNAMMVFSLVPETGFPEDDDTPVTV